MVYHLSRQHGGGELRAAPHASRSLLADAVLAPELDVLYNGEHPMRCPFYFMGRVAVLAIMRSDRVRTHSVFHVTRDKGIEVRAGTMYAPDLGFDECIVQGCTCKFDGPDQFTSCA